MLDLVQTGSPYFQITGTLSFNRCDAMTAVQPVTFLTEDSCIELPKWQIDSADGSSLQFQFTTNEPNGLLMYSLGAKGTSVYFGIEIIEG